MHSLHLPAKVGYEKERSQCGENRGEHDKRKYCDRIEHYFHKQCTPSWRWSIQEFITRKWEFHAFGGGWRATESKIKALSFGICQCGRWRVRSQNLYGLNQIYSICMESAGINSGPHVYDIACGVVKLKMQLHVYYGCCENAFRSGTLWPRRSGQGILAARQ